MTFVFDLNNWSSGKFSDFERTNPKIEILTGFLGCRQRLRACRNEFKMLLMLKEVTRSGEIDFSALVDVLTDIKC